MIARLISALRLVRLLSAVMSTPGMGGVAVWRRSDRGTWRVVLYKKKIADRIVWDDLKWDRNGPADYGILFDFFEWPFPNTVGEYCPTCYTKVDWRECGDVPK